VERPANTQADNEPTILMKDGWHCLHLFYRVLPAAAAALSERDRREGRDLLVHLLNPKRQGAPARMQTSLVAGHKADLAVMLLDPNPLTIESIRQELRAGPLGSALELAWSFVSITEVSEYVPTVEQYAQRLQQEGAEPGTPAFAAKLKAYEDREVVMRRQRLFPELPEWPVICFYPMNKIRHPLANWYTQPYSHRMQMMTEHGKSGMKFAGKVTQLITASTGLDDWEWGVTLWGREPAFIKEIVYTMRFDEASANYAQFGPFYLSYVVTPAQALDHLRL